MKKRFIGILLGGIALATASTVVLTSCNNQDVATQTFKITYRDGDSVLKTIEVKGGTKLEEYTPTKDGYKFLGWYLTPNFSHKYDANSEVTEDVTLFANFKLSQYVEDTRTWYILGNGSKGLLYESNWGKSLKSSMKLVKEDVKDENKFTITLDLHEDDEFQFGINSSWHNQRGGGYLATTKDGDNECFKVAGGALAKNTKKSNIKCLKDGNYTITLTTNPGEDYYDTADTSYKESEKEAFNYNDFDTITFKYNGAIKEEKEPEKEPDLESFQIIIKGSMSEWKESERYNSTDLKVSFEYTFAQNDEFGFAWFKDASETGYGTYIKYETIGTTGTANSKFEAKGVNFLAKEACTVDVVIEISKDRVVTVNFNSKEA